MREAVKRFSENLPVDIRRARQNAYKFIEREGLSRRELFTGAAALLFAVSLETWPTSRTAQHDEAAKKFVRLREAFLAGDRQFVIDGVPALRALLAHDHSAFAFRVKTHLAELLRDTGEVVNLSTTFTPPRAVFRALEIRAIVIERKWAAAGDHLNLARGLLTRASLYRQRSGRESDSTRLLKAAEQILRGLCLGRNRKLVNLLLHQTLSWRFRLETLYPRELDTDKAEGDFSRLRELAAGSGSVIPAITTARDEAAFWEEMQEPARSELVLQPARAQFSVLAGKSVIAELSFRRAEVELSILRSQHEAIEGIREFRQLWQKNPTAAQFKALRTLEEKLAEKFGLQPSGHKYGGRVYSTPILAELWMDERLTAL